MAWSRSRKARWEPELLVGFMNIWVACFQPVIPASFNRNNFISSNLRSIVTINR